ncbi:MAG: dienelactone hydrolase family protein [Caulobacterales bacterium]
MKLRLPSDTLEARWRQLAPHVEIVRPAGVGPWPTVVMFHGCGGRRPYLSDYMNAAAKAGVMAVSVDSFAPRGISRNRALATVCTGLELPGWRRAGDVLASLWGLSTIEGADPARVALAGWSHGGWSIMDLMTMDLGRAGEAGIDDPNPALLNGVQALVLAYPYCGPGALSQLRPWRRAPAVFAFVGEGDRVAHPDLCRRAFRQAERAGATVQAWYPPGATHAFDEDGSGFSFFRYDAELTGEAQARMAEFLVGALATQAPAA